MIPVYVPKNFNQLDEGQKKMCLQLETMLNTLKTEGVTASDMLNVLINATVNLAHATGNDRELIEDFVKTCFDNVAKYPREAFYRRKP